eukprot:TRINITY_DN22513_c0_g1_i4.p1 TRINITY_DN22513_c0_g1~~TRINITY_DN22513_c0_g1_i4.p1  ORF type:complete len:225 (-),score=68.94 TRINITY_DN22513_c0_g1_i4:121-795(-)
MCIRDRSKATMQARQSWKKIMPEVDTKFKELDQIFQSNSDSATESWGNSQESNLTPKDLGMRGKTVELIGEQIETIRQMVEGNLKQRMRSLDEKANKAAEALKQLSPNGLPDLDPASVEHYEKYLTKESEIDKYFDQIYEQNVGLLKKADEVLDNTKHANAIFEEMEQEMDDVTLVAEKAVEMSAKVNRWLKARGCGMVTIYVLMILLVLGICFAVYTAWGGST